MSARLRVLGLLPVFLLIGACGSSTTSSSHSGSVSTAATTTTAATSTITATATTATVGTTTSPTATTDTQTSASGSGQGGGGAAGIRVPATFVIHAGDRLSPSTVSSPAFLAVQLTVTSGDGRSHRVTLRVPGRPILIVPSHGGATVLLKGLRAGRYPLQVDGAPHGALLIGGEPGP